MNNKMKNEITPLTVDEELQWRDIVNRLVDQITGETVDDIPDNVIKATELLLSGMPFHEVAKRIGVTTPTVKGWVKKYPPMAFVLKEGRQLLAKWRIAKLEQQYLAAIEKSQEILDMDLYSDPDDERSVNSKLTGVVAQQARFIISQFTKVNEELSLTSDGTSVTLKASPEALDYIADRLVAHREKEEPIEATYRVIDDKNTANKHIPLLDEKGQPFFGELGELKIDEEGHLQCHICGNYYTSLSAHLYTKHELPPDVYELSFMLEEGTIKDAEA